MQTPTAVQTPDAATTQTTSRGRSLLANVVRLSGWSFLTAGAVIVLYLIYSQFYTGLETSAAQAALLEDWELSVGDVRGELGDTPVMEREVGPAASDEPGVVEPGDALAVLQFARPGSDSRPVHAEPLFVVEGVGVTDLQRGPGHYPGTALPGQPGNFAVAGHRTTNGAPFFHLDDLRAGDEIHVTDRTGTRHLYTVVEQRIVDPDASWVLGPDPLGSGRPTLTLTTCHPRFSLAQRLIVFAELVDYAVPAQRADPRQAHPLPTRTGSQEPIVRVLPDVRQGTV